MSDRSRDDTQRHPADERTADQSTQSAGGLGTVRPGPGPEIAEDVFNRNEQGRYRTPRQYEADEENDAPESRKP
jgi:hypothetical protein